jgi:hypothetical protein
MSRGIKVQMSRITMDPLTFWDSSPVSFRSFYQSLQPKWMPLGVISSAETHFGGLILGR